MRLFRRSRPRAVVLLYHRVAVTTDDPYGLAVRPETLARQLDHLAREHPIVPLGTLVDDLDDRRYEDGTVAISFDDGYADNLTAAIPIAAGLPLTVFVTVEPVLDGGRFWWDELAGVEAGRRGALHAQLKALPGAARREALASMGRHNGGARGRPLTVDELRDLASCPGVEIGAHSLTHPSLAHLPAGEQGREVSGSRSRLEEALGRPVTLLAYPFGKPGDVSDETRRQARRAGYRAAFTSVPKCLVPSSPLFALPRLTVHEWPVEQLIERMRQVLEDPA